VDKDDVKAKILIAVFAAIAGFSIGLAVGAGAGLFRATQPTHDAVTLLDRQAAAAEQDAKRTIADLSGTVEQLLATVGGLEERLRSERARVVALEEHWQESRRIYQQLIEGNRGADADFDEAIELIESLLAQE
jgi:hypothetical protein